MQVLPTILQTVQTNCHIADSQHAGDYTMCVYLLKMRELFRWEKGLAYDANLPKEELGNWLSEREQLWESFADKDYIEMDLAGETISPFESDRINEILNQQGLVYSGGLGQHAKPHFFLAELLGKESHGEFNIYVSGKEYARDLTAPPAMARDKDIYIRRESLGRMLWEKIEEWRWNRNKGAMAKALSFYDFDRDLHKELQAMTDNELHSVMLHEIGEVRAGSILGEDWNEMLYALPRSQAELMARAVRDHLADCLSTLPSLIADGRDASLYFYFGNFKSMRREIFPSLLQAFQDWSETGNRHTLMQWVEKGRDHWQKVARQIVDAFLSRGGDSSAQIAQLVQDNKL